MRDLREFPDSWDSFQQGQPEAFRHYFHLHHYRIFCYLLRLARDRPRAEKLTGNAFKVLFHHRETLADAEHLLRRLYWHARAGFFMSEAGYTPLDELDIMEDLEIARNETLIALQAAIRRLPKLRREVAELYFFQGLSIKAIARHLGVDEPGVKAFLSDTLKQLGEELAGKNPDEKNSLPAARV